MKTSHQLAFLNRKKYLQVLACSSMVFWLNHSVSQPITHIDKTYPFSTPTDWLKCQTNATENQTMPWYYFKRKSSNKAEFWGRSFFKTSYFSNNISWGPIEEFTALEQGSIHQGKYILTELSSKESNKELNLTLSIQSSSDNSTAELKIKMIGTMRFKTGSNRNKNIPATCYYMPNKESKNEPYGFNYDRKFFFSYLGKQTAAALQAIDQLINKTN